MADRVNRVTGVAGEVVAAPEVGPRVTQVIAAVDSSVGADLHWDMDVGPAMDSLTLQLATLGTDVLEGMIASTLCPSRRVLKALEMAKSNTEN